MTEEQMETLSGESNRAARHKANVKPPAGGAKTEKAMPIMRFGEKKPVTFGMQRHGAHAVIVMQGETDAGVPVEAIRPMSREEVLQLVTFGAAFLGGFA